MRRADAEMRRAAVRAVAAISRTVHPRGTERLLRALHDPDHRQWSIKGTSVLKPSGLRMHVDTSHYLEWCIFFFGCYEPEIAALLTAAAEPGTVALDVGANVGVHTLALAAAIGRGRVIAVEPNPIAHDRLKKNLGLNRLSNVTVHRLAVGDAPGRAALHVGEGSLTDLIGTVVPAVPSQRSIQVEITTLDSIVSPASGRVSVLKIDVEGYEGAVLKGARRILERDRPLLVFEHGRDAWDRAGGSLSAVIRDLEAIGYDRFQELDRSGLRPLSDPPPDFTMVVATAPPDVRTRSGTGSGRRYLNEGSPTGVESDSGPGR